MVLLLKLSTTSDHTILENHTVFLKISDIHTSLMHQGEQVYLSPHKAEVLAQQFERSHHLTLNLGTPHHSIKITRFVDRDFQGTTPLTPSLQFTNIYEMKRRITSLKPGAAQEAMELPHRFYVIFPAKPSFT
jgi:hypothetical protein